MAAIITIGNRGRKRKGQKQQPRWELFADDPLLLKELCWPQVEFSIEQVEIILSIRDNRETVVPAANMMGKDFVAGFICVWFFLTRTPCRVVTTSAGEDHLRVLWAEIDRFIKSSRIPLDYAQGGPLILNHQEVKKIVTTPDDAISYMIGMVASDDNIAKMQGHHANPMDLERANDGVPRSLFVADESSSVKDEYYNKGTTWAKRVFCFGNTWPCENFFKWAVKGRPGTNDRGGDRPRPVDIEAGEKPGDRGYDRKIIRIKASDSPNVRLGFAEAEKGLVPSGRTLIPGLKGYLDYINERNTRDPVWICVAHDADWYEGGETLLYPPEWLNAAEEWAEKLKELVRAGRIVRKAKSIGIDSAEGGDDTAWAVIDEYGPLEIVTQKTSNTTVITAKTIALGRKWGVSDDNWIFDRGGGGQQHADRLREQGFKGVRTVGFGDTNKLTPKRGLTRVEDRKANLEQKYAYVNLRAEMYWKLADRFDPELCKELKRHIWALPREYSELRRQLAIMPKVYDQEGRARMPSKTKGKRQGESKEKTIVELLGRSPDEADALVLANWGMENKPKRVRAGAAFNRVSTERVGGR